MSDQGKNLAECAGCIFFRPDPAAIGREGNCHRRPPQIVSVSTRTPEGVALVPGAMFPRVGVNWFCGEFQPKLPPKGAAN